MGPIQSTLRQQKKKRTSTWKNFKHGTDYSLVKLQLHNALSVIISYHKNAKQTPNPMRYAKYTNDAMRNYRAFHTFPTSKIISPLTCYWRFILSHVRLPSFNCYALCHSLFLKRLLRQGNSQIPTSTLQLNITYFTRWVSNHLRQRATRVTVG